MIGTKCIFIEEQGINTKYKGNIKKFYCVCGLEILNLFKHDFLFGTSIYCVRV